jgi:hypothetical protein
VRVRTREERCEDAEEMGPEKGGGYEWDDCCEEIERRWENVALPKGCFVAVEGAFERCHQRGEVGRRRRSRRRGRRYRTRCTAAS